MMQGSLRKEMWLPVLNDGGKVIGCIARSVSRSLPKKYYHPVVRVAVIYQGMLYLVNRGRSLLYLLIRSTIRFTAMFCSAIV